MSVAVSIVETLEGTGHVLSVKISYRGGGTGSLWLSNIQEVTEDNKLSLRNCQRTAEWLAGKTFSQDVTIELQERRKDVTGRSWEQMLTLGLCSLLSGTPLRLGLTGTGRIGEGGKILEVSSYVDKCWAAYEAGYKVFLVPVESLTESKQLEQLQVVPVSNITQAWAIATGHNIPQQARPAQSNWASALGFNIVNSPDSRT